MQPFPKKSATAVADEERAAGAAWDDPARWRALFAAIAALRTLARDQDPFVAAKAALSLADIPAAAKGAPATDRR